nr:ADP-ribosylglycohydrolase family protein [Paracoccus liaowanqingii]
MQSLPRTAIHQHYGQITGFVAPCNGHPVLYGPIAGQVTDDTEQCLLLARRLIADPVSFDDLAWASNLMAWEAAIRERGLRNLLGPSS